MTTRTQPPRPSRSKGGKIVAVGKKDDVLKLKGDATKVIDLKGQTLMPGLIDPHSHVIQVAAKMATANLSPPPVGSVDTMDKLKQALREYKQAKKLKPGEWIIAMGYDDTAIKEKRHPTREDLDDVSTENPIFIFHISNHLAAVNSKADQPRGLGGPARDALHHPPRCADRAGGPPSCRLVYGQPRDQQRQGAG